MLLKSIKLHNIRSYENQEINFPLGSVLLAGDIGSGKSTILLAVEFAIFGVKKGELSASALLRHGKKEGSIELRMEIDGKDVTIKRAFKRSNEDIKQEAGYVIINGVKKEGTAEELRAMALDLLGYPKDLIKKGKDLIYRYTVYTPQEEMKKILYEGRETRLDTLRKVFNIDKYKRIAENSKIIIAFLREKKRYLEGFVIDLEHKKKEIEERRNEILLLDGKISGMVPKINQVKNILIEKKKSAGDIEGEIIQLNNLRKELSVAQANLFHRIEQNSLLNEEIKILDGQIEELNKALENKPLENLETLKEKIEGKEMEIARADNDYKNSIRKIRELEVNIENCSSAIKKLSSLEICPVCEQKVAEGHKHSIVFRETKKHEELAEEIKKRSGQESMLSKARAELKKELDALIKEERHLSVLKIKFENLNEKTGLREEKSLLKEKIKKDIGLLNSRKAELDSKIKGYSEADEKYKTARKGIDNLLSEERFLELEKGKYEVEKSSLSRFVANAEKEINEKQKAKEKLAYILQLNNWLGELFINLISAMEKHVMLNINSQFNELFRNWFDILIEDEAISVMVDEEFTPVIEQNGYETYIENLSGGEKTSVALSYRLALNKVVNDAVSGIKTKDIIMLDEPTDGFSAEQLDKVRDVLGQLNIKQIILVSHESKIESFVDNVIRIKKDEHVSMVY